MSPRGHLLVHSGLLAVPLVGAVAVGLVFLFQTVPGIDESERRSVTLEYRERLDDLKAETNRWAEIEELLAHSRIATNDFVRAQPRAKEVWGFIIDPSHDDRTVLWRMDGGRRVWTAVPTLTRVNYRVLFWTVFAVLTVLFTALTIIGIRYFVSYVKSRDDFLAATAHDLTTPLVGMRYAIGRSPEDAKCLNERMLRLVENIREFLRLGGRRREPQLTVFDLRAAYDEAYALFGEDYRDLFDGGDVPVAGEGPFWVRADETMTVQVLWNLLGNDLKYAAPHGPVRARFVRRGGFVEFSLADEGPGMSPRERRRAFDRYYRAKTVLESGKGGFGIGLCAAREFVEAMGGTLAVAANDPRGCVFTLRLPEGRP